MKKLEGEIKISSEEISAAIKSVALEISQRYRNGVTILGVLKAGKNYVEELGEELARLKCQHMIGWIGGKSFEGEDRTQKFVVYSVPSSHLTHKKPVILLDTICDSGSTLQKLGSFLVKGQWRPRTIEVSALVCALDPIPDWMQSAYIGFQIPKDHLFLIGYGLDYNDKFRDLPEIREITEDEKGLKDTTISATV